MILPRNVKIHNSFESLVLQINIEEAACRRYHETENRMQFVGT